MSKIKVKLDKAPEAPVGTPEVVVEEKAEQVFPQVSANKKFQYVEVSGQYVVYNPDGCRVSGLLTLTAAKDIVLRQNLAAHIKG